MRDIERGANTMTAPDDNQMNELQMAEDRMLCLIFGALQAQAIAVAAELGIADLLKSDAASAAELAAATGTDVTALTRILRLLTQAGVLVHDAATDRYRCTRVGALLQGDAEGCLRDYARLTNAGLVLQTISRLVDAARSGTSQYLELQGTPFYQDLPNHPELAASFSGAMREISKQDALVMLGALDLSDAKRVVDVGGGQGHLIAALLNAYPDLKAVLFDLPDVVAGADPALQRFIEQGRCRVVGGDFRESVPPGGDLYILKRVLSHCTRDDGLGLLKNVRAAVAADARLIIADPDPAALYGASFDVLMLVLLGGGLHTDEALREMFAGSGFRFERSFETSPGLRLVEAAAC